jgi:tetratricopeptide (TPR) repeat protein
MRREGSQWVDQLEIPAPIEYIEHSVELAHAGHLSEAVEEIQRQISEHPECHLLNYWLGILLYDQGEYEDACEAFERELKITPRFRDAAWELGSACSRLGFEEKTIDAYRRALDIDPCCVQALYGLGNAYIRTGEYHKAIEYYEDALFLQPELDQSDPRVDEEQTRSMAAEIHIHLGLAWMAVVNPEKAKESFVNAQKIRPDGQVAKRAQQYLQLLSEEGDNLDSVSWRFIASPLEEI